MVATKWSANCSDLINLLKIYTFFLAQRKFYIRNDNTLLLWHPKTLYSSYNLSMAQLETSPKAKMIKENDSMYHFVLSFGALYPHKKWPDLGTMLTQDFAQTCSGHLRNLQICPPSSGSPLAEVTTASGDLNEGGQIWRFRR